MIPAEFAPAYFGILIVAIRDERDGIVEIDHAAGALMVLGEGWTIYATPGWEGDQTTIPVEVHFDSAATRDGLSACELNEIPVEWSGNVATDVRIWWDALQPIIARARERVGEGADSND